MVDRVTVGGLQIAPVLHAFVRDEALPGSGVDEAAFWSGCRGDPGRVHPAQPRAAGPPRRAPAAARRVAREEPRPGRRPGGVRPAAPRPRLPRRRAGRLHDRDQRRRRRGRRPGRPAARRTRAQRAVRGQRRQRPLGLALRRALRHRRAARGRRPGARVVVQPEARRRGHRQCAGVPRRALPARVGSPRRRTAYAIDGRGPGGSATAGDWRTRRSYVGWRGEPEAPEGVLLVHHGLHVEIQVDRERQHRQGPTRPA